LSDELAVTTLGSLAVATLRRADACVIRLLVPGWQPVSEFAMSDPPLE
jgi:hypothetical protein